MSGWRDRLDRTTNWAITVVAALLSVSLSTPSAHHGVLVFAMLLISLLLYVESRRYRFYDVYRMRVRQFERHYFGQLFSGTEGGPEPWLEMMAQDLRHPTFRIDMVAAITRRLKRNYIWLYAILLLAWVLKITSPKLLAGAGTDAVPPMQSIFESAALGTASRLAGDRTDAGLLRAAYHRGLPRTAACRRRPGACLKRKRPGKIPAFRILVP